MGEGRDPSRPLALEVCVDTPTGAAVAAAAGADRVEICAALALGGLTPGPGLVAAAMAAPLPVHAMIRPRPGGFALADGDLPAMLADVAVMRNLGVAGVVIGAARPDGALDRDALARLIDAAGPLTVTLHRVFDTVPDPVEALETAVDLGLARILTSGGAAKAPDGADRIARLARAADGRVEIMAGGGVTPDAAPRLVEAGVDALHASCAVTADGPDPFGFGHAARTDPARVAALRTAMAEALCASA